MTTVVPGPNFVSDPRGSLSQGAARHRKLLSRLKSFFLILLFLNIGAGNGLYANNLEAEQAPAAKGPERGAWLAEQVENRDVGKDSRTSIRMKLFDKQGRARERALSLLTLRGGAGRPVPGDRTLVRFSSPADIKGTGFLVFETPNGDDERFLYLPSLGRVRRIAGAETQESFVGSDFTYEDIGGRELERYTYTMLDENASWKAADGSAHSAYRLESKQKDADAKFPRVVTLVLKDSFVTVHAEIFNRRNEVQKIFDARKVEKTDGYWTILAMQMTDQLAQTRTELLVESVEYDNGLTADNFSRRELERVTTGSSGKAADRP
jgi:hypothetical protein